MKKILLCLFCLLLTTPVFSYDLTFHGVFYNLGQLDGPDSLRVNATFYTYGGATLDTVFNFGTLPAVWDSTFIRTDAYLRAILVYKAFFGTDSSFAEEEVSLQYDSTNTAGYFSKVASTNWNNATRTLTSFSGVGSEVWNNPIRTVTDKSDYTLAAAEYTDIANAVKTLMEGEGSQLWSVAYYLGALHNHTAVLFPRDGTSPKDSVVIYDGSGVAQMAIIYKHSNSSSVLDSIQVKQY